MAAADAISSVCCLFVTTARAKATLDSFVVLCVKTTCEQVCWNEIYLDDQSLAFCPRVQNPWPRLKCVCLF